MNRQKGLALVLVLWMLTLLSIMAGSFALSMRRETAIIIGLKNNGQARALAEAGIALAELMMLNNAPELRWHTDGRIYQVDYAGARIRLRLLSEAGKININTADEIQLRELMLHSGLDDLTQQQVVDAILDWRDSDDIVSANGAEKDEYLAAGLKYAPSNQPFQSMAEVQMVLGMDETVFNWLEPLITIYSKRQVDVQKASREVLQVLNLEDSSIDQQPAFDERVSLQNDSLEMTEEQSAPPLGADEVVTIISEAMVAADMKATLKAVVKKSSGGSQPFQILSWETDMTGHSSLFAADMDELLEAEYAGSRFDN